MNLFIVSISCSRASVYPETTGMAQTAAAVPSEDLIKEWTERVIGKFQQNYNITERTLDEVARPFIRLVVAGKTLQAAYQQVRSSTRTPFSES